jgi:hypothetical protein
MQSSVAVASPLAAMLISLWQSKVIDDGQLIDGAVVSATVIV